MRGPAPALDRSLSNEFLVRILADGYALLGRKADAILRVRAAIDRGFISYPNLSRAGVFLANLRAEPEFQALMAELKPRWEALIEWERGVASS